MASSWPTWSELPRLLVIEPRHSWVSTIFIMPTEALLGIRPINLRISFRELKILKILEWTLFKHKSSTLLKSPNRFSWLCRWRLKSYKAYMPTFRPHLISLLSHSLPSSQLFFLVLELVMLFPTQEDSGIFCPLSAMVSRMLPTFVLANSDRFLLQVPSEAPASLLRDFRYSENNVPFP